MLKKVLFIFLYIVWRGIAIRGIPSDYAPYVMSYHQLGAKVLLVGMGFILFHKYLWRSLKSIHLLEQIKICLAVLLGIILTIGLINVILFHHSSPFVFNYPVAERTPQFVFLALIVAPIFEELFYRYSIIYLGEKRWLRRLSVAASVLLFALSHMANVGGNLFALYPFLFIGIYLTMAYMWKQNIWTSIFAHMAYNLTVMILAVVMG